MFSHRWLRPALRTQQHQPHYLLYLGQETAEDQLWVAQAGRLQPLNLADLHGRGHRVSTWPTFVLLDLKAVRVDRLTLPPGVKPQEAPLLIEDELAEPLEALEHHVWQRQGREILLLSWSREQRQAWQERLDALELRIQGALPMSLALSHWHQSLGARSPWRIEWGQRRFLVTGQPEAAISFPAECESLLAQQAGFLRALETEPPIETQVLDQQSWSALDAALPSRLFRLWRPQMGAQWCQQWRSWPWQKIRPLAPWLLAACLWPWATAAIVPAQDWRTPLAPLLDVSMRTPEQARLDLQQRLEAVQQLRERQHQALSLWEPIAQQLAQQSSWRLVAWQADAQGLRIGLQGVQEDQRRELEALGGRWEFAEQQAQGQWHFE